MSGERGCFYSSLVTRHSSLFFQRLIDAAQQLAQLSEIGARHGAQNLFDVRTMLRNDFLSEAAALRRQAHLDAAPVSWKRFAIDQSFVFQPVNDASQVAG